jgi:hypothetical protein
MRVKTERIFLGFLLFAVLNSPVFSVGLYILVAETGSGAKEGSVSQDEPGVGFDSSFLWEACLMDVLFEAGHIVSNSPILGLGPEIPGEVSPGGEPPFEVSPGGEFPGELGRNLAEARSGMADYLILALLHYPAAADKRTRPERVDLKLYSLEPDRFVYGETGFPVPAGGSAAAANEAQQARQLIRSLIPHIKD